MFFCTVEEVFQSSLADILRLFRLLQSDIEFVKLRGFPCRSGKYPGTLACFRDHDLEFFRLRGSGCAGRSRVNSSALDQPFRLAAPAQLIGHRSALICNCHLIGSCHRSIVIILHHVSCIDRVHKLSAACPVRVRHYAGPSIVIALIIDDLRCEFCFKCC